MTTLKPLTAEITTNWKILKRNWKKKKKKLEYQPTLPVMKNLYAGQEATVRSDMEQWTSSKLGKEYDKAVYCHPAFLTSVQSTSCNMLGWMNHKLESTLLGEISTNSDM